MKENVFACILLFAVACNSADTGKDSKETAEHNIAADSSGWQNLVNGKDIPWHTYGKTGLGSAWKHEGDVLHLDASAKEEWQTKNGGDIVTNDEFENFHLRLEWKISEAGNSGIMFYVNEDTSKYKYAWESGPEMQIADNEKNEDGKIVKSRAGELYELMAISKNTVKPAGEWNQVEIIANNGKLDFHINGEHVLSTVMWNDEWKKLISQTKFNSLPGFGTFRKGKIALQDHGADVWFRNVMIRRL
jgi:hypothetical protein